MFEFMMGIALLFCFGALIKIIKDGNLALNSGLEAIDNAIRGR